jgi:hypothetical protein
VVFARVARAKEKTKDPERGLLIYLQMVRYNKNMKEILRNIFKGEKTPGSTPFPEISSYRYFKERSKRHDVYEFCKELTTYLAKNNISNVMFIDRGARPAWIGVHEYWKEHYPDRPLPGIYFINPDTVDETIRNTIEMFNVFGSLAGKGALTAEGMPTEFTSDTQEKFKQTYTDLIEEKNEPIVFFDTCSHTGKTLVPILGAIKHIGFTDVRVITAARPNMVSPVEVDTHIDKKTKLHQCYPFGLDDLVIKGSDIISERNDDDDGLAGSIIRKEIRQIVRDKGK